MMSRRNFLKGQWGHVLSWRRKMYSDWEDITSCGRVFQIFGTATGKARLPTVDRLTSGTRRRLMPVELSDRLPGRFHTGASGPRNVDALPWRTLNVSRAIFSKARQWCGRKIAGERTPVQQHSAVTVVAVQGMQQSSYQNNVVTLIAIFATCSMCKRSHAAEYNVLYLYNVV